MSGKINKPNINPPNQGRPVARKRPKKKAPKQKTQFFTTDACSAAPSRFKLLDKPVKVKPASTQKTDAALKIFGAKLLQERQRELKPILEVAKRAAKNWKRRKVNKSRTVMVDLSNKNLSKINFLGLDLILKKIMAIPGSNRELKPEFSFAGANLSGVTINDFSKLFRKADFQNANLSGANLKASNFLEANFLGANLDNANFQGSVLKKAKLAYASLNNANFADANLQNAYLNPNLFDFDGKEQESKFVNFNRARMHAIDMSNKSFLCSSFNQSQMPYAILSDTDLRGSSFRNAQMQQSSIENADTRGFDDMFLGESSTDFTQADLSKANISGMPFLEQAVLDGANFFGAVHDSMVFDYESQNKSWLRRNNAIMQAPNTELPRIDDFKIDAKNKAMDADTFLLKFSKAVSQAGRQITLFGPTFTIDMSGLNLKGLDLSAKKEELKKILTNDGKMFSGLPLEPIFKFEGANLEGADLSGLSSLFNFVSFKDANLCNADLSWGEFRKANFVGTNLEGATMIGSNLAGSIVAAKEQHQIKSANFNGANMSLANLDSVVNLTRANFDTTNIYNVSGNKSKLQQLQGAIKVSPAESRTATTHENLLKKLSAMQLILSLQQAVEFWKPYYEKYGNEVVIDLKMHNFEGADFRSLADKIEQIKRPDYMTDGDSLKFKINFERAIFKNADLRGLSDILAESDCTGADFSGANLSGLKMQRAKLSSAKFNDANLVNADLSVSPEGLVDLDVDFQNANLTNARLAKRKFTRANFEGANLNSTKYGKNELKGCSFKNASMVNAMLLNSDIGKDEESKMLCDFQGADLRWANLKWSRFEDIPAFKDAKMFKVNLDDTRFAGDLKSLLDRGADFEDKSFSGIDLSDMSFGGKQFARSGFDFRGAILKRVDLSKRKITNMDLTGANLQSANLEESEFGGSILHNAIFNQANIKNANFIGVDLNGADLTMVEAEGAKFTNATLDNSVFNFAKNLRITATQEDRSMTFMRGGDDHMLRRKRLRMAEPEIGYDFH